MKCTVSDGDCWDGEKCGSLNFLVVGFTNVETDYAGK